LVKQNYVAWSTGVGGRILLALVATGLHAVARAEASALREACDAPAYATTLVPAASSAPIPARVIALSSALLQWPKTPSQGHFVLATSATGALVARPGEPLAGADDTLALSISTNPVPPPLAQRFKYVGAGAVLEAADPGRVARALRGQALVVREDDHGRVLDVAAVQVAGALDAAYAAAAKLTDLGVTPARGGARFALWAPTARAVAVAKVPR